MLKLSKGQRKELSKLLDSKWNNATTCYMGTFTSKPQQRKIRKRNRK